MANPLNYKGSTYRNYLQGLANQGDLAANALLQVSGDDGRVNDNVNDRDVLTLNNDYWLRFGANAPAQTNYGAANSAAGSGAARGSTGGSAGGGGSADDVRFLQDQENQLRNLLNRTETGLNQGLTRNEDEYQRSLGRSNADRDRAYAGYQDQRVEQNKGKLGAYDTINKNANTGYRSLAQIIGRASGTGSSAFRDLLPNVIGTDTSSRRREVSNTYGQNLAGIDKAQNQYEISFKDVLDDLLNQKKRNEEDLRTGVETQRQNINQQLATVAGQRAQAQGGGYAQVRAAQAPFQSAIDNSRNTVEGFFNQFRTAFTPRQAVAATPDLAGYTVDRANLNAQQQQGVDPNNPYAQLLRRRLQGQL